MKFEIIGHDLVIFPELSSQDMVRFAKLYHQLSSDEQGFDVAIYDEPTTHLRVALLFQLEQPSTGEKRSAIYHADRVNLLLKEIKMSLGLRTNDTNGGFLIPAAVARIEQLLRNLEAGKENLLDGITGEKEG